MANCLRYYCCLSLFVCETWPHKKSQHYTGSESVLILNLSERNDTYVCIIECLFKSLLFNKVTYSNIETILKLI